MIHYIIQTVAFQLLFLVVYDLFLKKETFFNWNRTYLLLTPLLSLVLPFIQIGSIREAIPASYTIQLPAVIVGGNGMIEGSAATGFQFPWFTFWIAGLTVSLLWFSFKYHKILRIRRSSRKITHPQLDVREIPGSNTAFTFFNTIYLGEALSEKQKEHILLHEEIHVNEFHTWDLILFELLRIIFWFNPLVYIFQNRISALHEFTADRKVALAKKRNVYYQQMLSQVFQTESISFINTFFNHSLIKNRIVMLQKSNSKQIFQLKYLLILPVLCAMIIYTSCAQEAEVAVNDTSASNDFTAGTNSEILDNIVALKESIAAKGDMTPEEQKALKTLYVLTSEEGVNNAYFGDVHQDLEIPFGVIQKVPTYPGCEGLSNEAAKKCFTEKVTTFVVQNFNTKIPKDSGIKGRQRIAVHFTISEDGTIKNVKAKAQHSELIDEAIRVVEMLPKMIPGEHDGKKVNVEFALPIIFEID